MTRFERSAEYPDRNRPGDGSGSAGDSLSAFRTVGERLLAAAGRNLRPRSAVEAVQYVGSGRQRTGQ